MTNRYSIILALLMSAGATIDSLAQATAPVPPIDAVAGDTIYNPEIIYSPIPRTYEIAGISVSGISHVEDYVIIGYSGLSVGERIDIPGDAISNAANRCWRQARYSKGQITVDK
ncbi:MAG: outer membrane protein assembly factor BamA, partial [Muribaculaceae bacterium]|nr:outer membrane protein assembly factor BamA [Muribaculaceae bacterium]